MSDRPEFVTFTVSEGVPALGSRKYATNAVAILIEDDCGISSRGDVCTSATFVCPHTSRSNDYWTFDPPALRREITQRFVQERANESAGCQCALEPTELDFGYLDNNGRVDGRLLDGDGVNTITVRLEPSGRVATFNFDTGALEVVA
jgi:hypothetical protein